ncbi:MAG: hypothetical protein IKU37_06025 [Candidatus Gastranaerophilales bacterium]|nr:hypothetical protein [Candidatus Gastranaerophilales bacterium]
MYIIELFLKLKEDFKMGKFKKQPEVKIQKIEKCNHFFVPIDSTKRILACSKCGEIYKLKKGENNPFEQTK